MNCCCSAEGQLGHRKRLILGFNLARTAQGDLIVGFDRDHRQESDGDQQKKAEEKAHCAGPYITQIDTAMSA
jgi:hypothetical protein